MINGAGAATTINTYDEYGQRGAANAGRFQFTGQAWLPEVSLYHYRARAYSPALGRFLQTDPILHAGGMNLYAYVGNDPLNATDPFGLQDNIPTFRPPGSRITRRGAAAAASRMYWDLSNGRDSPATFIGGASPMFDGEDGGDDIIVRAIRRGAVR